MRKLIKKSCKFCNQDFYCENWEDKRGRKYCSRECSNRDIANYERNKVFNNKCIDCGKKISKRSTRCLSCAGNRKRVRPLFCVSCGAPAPDERGFRGKLKLCQKYAMKKHGIKKIKRIKVTCYECGKLFEIRPCEFEKHNFCSTKCMGKWHSKEFSGENCYLWKGGAIDYYGPNWREQRRKARKRAHHQCEYCGKPKNENGKALDVHHIKPFRSFNYIPEKNKNYILANDMDNLVALCVSCHRSVKNNGIKILSRDDI